MNKSCIITIAVLPALLLTLPSFAGDLGLTEEEIRPALELTDKK